MRKKFLLLIVCFFSAYTLSFAQSGKLKGVMTDANTGETLIQANVTVDSEGNVGTVTDFDGNYEITVEPGTYKVEYSYIGYKTEYKNVTINAGETVTMNVALGEETELLDVVVVSASKFEKKLSEETVSMEVIQPDLLQNNNITDMEEGMKRVPGVTVVEGQANIRGGSGWSYGAGSRVLIWVDDIPLLSADAADAKWSLIPVENTHQVEVIKGAASALYGSSALNGIINVRTAYPTDKPYTSINFTTGIYGHPKSTYFDDRASLTDTVLQQQNPAQYEQVVADYSAYRADSAEHLYNNANWWKREKNQPFFSSIMLAHRRKIGRVDLVGGAAYNGDNSYLNGGSDQNIRFNLKLRYRAKKEGLSFGINGNVLQKLGAGILIWNGLGDQTYQPLAGTVSNFISTRATIDPFLTYLDPKGNKFSLRTRFFNATNTNDTDQGSVPNLYYGEFQYQRRIESWDMNVVTGAVGSYSTVRSPGETAANSLIGEHEGFNVGAYAQFDKRLLDKLSLALGLRYEFTKYDQSFQSDLKRPTLRLGVNYQAGRATYLRASYGEGYRFPAMAELFVQTNVGGLPINPNPALQPEDGFSGEIGIKQGFRIGQWQGFIDFAGFINSYKDMMEFTFAVSELDPSNLADSEFGFSSQNVGDTRIVGLELTTASEGTIAGKFPFTFLFGYTFIDPRSLNWEDSLNLYNSDGDVVQLQEFLGPLLNFINRDNIVDGGTNYTYATYSSSANNVMKYRNRHTIKWDAEITLNKFSIGANMQATSFMENVDYLFVSPFLSDIAPSVIESLQGSKAFEDFIKYREIRDGKWDIFLDLRASVKPSEETKITFIVKNVINQPSLLRPAFPVAPRNFALQFSYTF